MNRLKWALAIMSAMKVASTVIMIGIMIHYGDFWNVPALALSIWGVYDIKKMMNDFKKIKEVTK